MRVWFTSQPSWSSSSSTRSMHAMPSVRAVVHGSPVEAGGVGTPERRMPQRLTRGGPEPCVHMARVLLPQQLVAELVAVARRSVAGDAPQGRQVDEPVAHVGGQARGTSRRLGQDLAAL